MQAANGESLAPELDPSLARAIEFGVKIAAFELGKAEPDSLKWAAALMESALAISEGAAPRAPEHLEGRVDRALRAACREVSRVSACSHAVGEQLHPTTQCKMAMTKRFFDFAREAGVATTELCFAMVDAMGMGSIKIPAEEAEEEAARQELLAPMKLGREWLDWRRRSLELGASIKASLGKLEILASVVPLKKKAKIKVDPNALAEASELFRIHGQALPEAADLAAIEAALAPRAPRRSEQPLSVWARACAGTPHAKDAGDFLAKACSAAWKSGDWGYGQEAVEALRALEGVLDPKAGKIADPDGGLIRSALSAIVANMRTFNAPGWGKVASDTARWMEEGMGAAMAAAESEAIVGAIDGGAPAASGRRARI